MRRKYVGIVHKKNTIRLRSVYTDSIDHNLVLTYQTSTQYKWGHISLGKKRFVFMPLIRLEIDFQARHSIFEPKSILHL